MKDFVMEIHTEDDIYIAVSRVRSLIQDSFPEEDQQAAFVTILELGRNLVHYACREGWIHCQLMTDTLRIRVRDQGPGIPNLQEILSGNYRSPTGLGQGLIGVQRLMDEFYIETSKKGTDILAIKRPHDPK